MIQSVWPYDHTIDDNAEKQLGELWCFVICPSRIAGFDPKKRKFVSFDITINEQFWKLRIGSVEHSIPIRDLPEVFSEGRIIVASQFCWVGLKHMSIEAA